jgi:hypothetical protein
MEIYIATTRFNNKTWKENETFRKKCQKYKCIYPVEMLNTSISNNSSFIILEMNNDENKIMGIGIVKNKAFYQKYKVYEIDKYNNYVYVGKERIDITEMTKEELIIIKVFENLCFKGYNHLKRLKGIKIFSKGILEKCQKIMDLKEFLIKMFISRRTVTNENV